MQKFTTIKVGYTTGVYGCSNEYFTTIILNGDEEQAISHHGMYGSEDRINGALKAKGYKEFYITSYFGKMTKKDVCKWVVSETEALEKIKEL